MALQRTEVVALVNALNRLSESIQWSQEMHRMHLRQIEKPNSKPKSRTPPPENRTSGNVPSQPQVGLLSRPNYFVPFVLLTPVFGLLLWAVTFIRGSKKPKEM